MASLNARISVMEKLRPQPRDKNREIDDRTESERGEVLWVVRENLGSDENGGLSGGLGD